jgi:predicted permease
VNVVSELHSKSARLTSAASVARRGIAVVQIALSLALLVGALLVGRTLNALLQVESGFDHERLAGIYVSAEPQGYQQADVPILGSKMLERLRANPGVESAALARSVPFVPVTAGWNVNDPLNRSEQSISLQVQAVSDDYFRTLGIPILRGRAIEVRDWQGASSTEFNIVLSVTAAERLFSERDPLEQTLTTRGRQPWTLHVVGIARDARLNVLKDPIREVAYFPFHTFPFPGFSVVMRARGSPAALEPLARQALAGVEPAIPLDFQVVTENIRGQVTTERLLATLFTLFSLLAVLLAGIGLYGVLAAIVGERRREIGIRMALGARAGRVLLMVSRESATLVGLGVVLGLFGAFWLGRALESLLFGVGGLDPSVYLRATLLFVAVAALATALPTRAATRVQPAVALRHD